MTRSKPKKAPVSWYVSDDGVSMRTCKRELIVSSSGDSMRFSFPIEYRPYAGDGSQFSARGRQLAARLVKVLNAIEQHHHDRGPLEL